MKNKLSLAERVATLGHPLYPGYYLYLNGTVSPEKGADISPLIGVIGYVNPDPNAPIGKRAEVMSLMQQRVSWSEREVFFDVTNLFDSKENTHAIKEKADQIGIKVPAFSLCLDFSIENAVEAGEAYLLSREQMMKVAGNQKTINQALYAIGAPPFRGTHLTSSEYNKERAWQVDVDKHKSVIYAKTYIGDYARPFFSI